MPFPVKAGFWFTVSSFLQKTISFLTMPIFTRILNTEEYGAVTIFNSWESIFLLFVTLNVFYGAFNTAMVDFEGERDKYSSSLVGFIFLTSIIGLCVYNVFQSLIDMLTGMSYLLTCIMFCQILFQGIVSIWFARLKFCYNYIPVTIATIVLFGLSPIFSIIGIKLFPDYKVEAKLIGNIIAYIIVGSVAFFSLYSKGRILISSKYWKYAIAFSAPLIVHYLASMVLGQADRIMISKFINDSAAAVYAVAYSVSMILTILTTSANQAVVPWLFESIKANMLYKTQKTIYILLLLTVMALLLVMLVGPEIIKILATPDYYDAWWIIPPLMASLFFTFVYQLFANIEFYFKKNIYIISASIVAAIVNIVLNSLFIPIYGYKAAAYTTLICYMLFSMFHYNCARKVAIREGLGWPFNLFVVIGLSLMLLLLTGVVLFVYNNSRIRYGLLLSSAILLAIYYRTIIGLIRQILIKNDYTK